jgi:uncharacterized protein
MLRTFELIVCFIVYNVAFVIRGGQTVFPLSSVNLAPLSLRLAFPIVFREVTLMESDALGPTSGFARVAVRHPVAVFVALAYSFSWCFYLPMIIKDTVIVPLIVIATFGPSLAAIITHRITTGHFWPFPIGSSWRRVLFGTVIGFVLVVVTYVILPATIAAASGQLRWKFLLSVGVYNASTLLGGPLGEEPGWRGYALPRLEMRLGPFLGTLVLALIWTGWHLPLFLVSGWSSSPIWTYAMILCGVSFIMTFSFNLAGSSIFAAIAAHAAFNTVSKFLNGLLKGAEIHIQMPFETLMAFCGLAVAALLLVTTRGRLAYSKTSANGE